MSGGEKPMSGSWCILRTLPSRTLQLAISLADAGFEVWTPVESIKPAPPKRGPDERPSRPRKLPALVTRPLLPSFVFARADRLAELLALSRSPAQLYRVWDTEQRRMVVRGHPFFRLFHAGDDIPLVTDDQLAPLRRIASRRKPRGKPRVFSAGDQVKLIEGAFAGLTGTVQEMRGKFAKVLFPGSTQAFDFFPWVLIPVVDPAGEVH